MHQVQLEILLEKVEVTQHLNQVQQELENLVQKGKSKNFWVAVRLGLRPYLV